MLVTVQIDLAKDRQVFELAQRDVRIMGLYQIFSVAGDDTYLFQIGDELWALTTYADQVWAVCEDDIYDFCQPTALQFEFKTSEETAVLLMTGFSKPKLMTIIRPKLNKRTDLN